MFASQPWAEAERIRKQEKKPNRGSHSGEAHRVAQNKGTHSKSQSIQLLVLHLVKKERRSVKLHKQTQPD